MSTDSKSSQSSYWLKSGSFTLATKISNVSFGFINIWLLYRILPKDEVGIWIIFMSVTAILELIKNGFIRNPLIRFLNQSEDSEISDIQSSSLWLHIFMGLFQISLIAIFAGILSTKVWDAPPLQDLFYVYMLTVAMLVFVNHFEFLQQANLNFGGTFFMHFTRQGVLCACILIYVFSGYDLILSNLAWIYCFAVFCTLIVGFILARSILQLKWRMSKEWMSKLFHYGKFTFGTNISSSLLKRVDMWMLGGIINTEAVAAYDPAIRVSNLVEVPTDALTSIMFPQLSKEIASGGNEAARKLYEKAVGTIMAAMIPLVTFVIIFADWIVVLVAGNEYADSAPILRVTMLYGLVIPFNRLMGVTLDAIGKARMNFLFVMRNALINTVLNYILITNFGIIGAAYATLSTFTFAMLYNQLFVYRKLGINLIRIFKEMFLFYGFVFRKVKSFIS